MSWHLLHILTVTPNDISPRTILSHYCLSLCSYFINILKENTNIKLFSVYCFELTCALACVDQGSFARGMMGIQARLPENSSDNVFCFYSPQLVLQFYRGCPMVISKKAIIFQGFRGVPEFSRWGGGQLFPGGPNANFYRNGYKVVIFQGGQDPTPPSGSAHVWIRIG